MEYFISAIIIGLGLLFIYLALRYIKVLVNNKQDSLQVSNKRNLIKKGNESMQQVLKIGHLELPMGNVTLSVENTEQGLQKFLRYLAYQEKFNK